MLYRPEPRDVSFINQIITLRKYISAPKRRQSKKMIIDLQQNLIIVPFTHKVKMLYVLANVAIRVSITAILQLKLSK